MLDFEGKTVVLTGAAGGICALAAEMFKNLGARVVKLDYRFSKEKKYKGGAIEELFIDVTDRGNVFDVLDQVATTAGGIDVVVNGAGILRSKPFVDITEEEWDAMINVNLRGAFFVCQAALPVMMEQKSGVFVNIASISGQVGGVMAAADYSASKAGIICLTKSLAKTGAQWGIRANSIAPGAIDTPMLDVYRKYWGSDALEKEIGNCPMKRLGRPEEVASVIVFLASEMASFITGTCIDVNGGTRLN